MESFYLKLLARKESCFPFLSVWILRQHEMYVFTRLAARRVRLRVKKLRKRWIAYINWFFTCKCSAEHVDHFLLHCGNLVVICDFEMVQDAMGNAKYIERGTLQLKI